MIIIVGILVVFGSVVSGYLLEHGNIMVLLQPAELLIIGGAGVGTLLVANPPHVLKRIGRGIAGAFAKPRYTKENYLALLKTLYDLLTKARKDGMMSLEADVEKPEASVIIAKNPGLMKDRHALEFLCDSLRMTITGFEVYELDQVLDLDLEVHHVESAQPVTALSTMADSLPGLGIVAAVLGVVITMSAMGGPPEEIGKKVAAALVGTFLGVLMCYGLVSPLAQNLSKTAEAESAFLQVIRVVLIAYLKGSAPIVAVEVGRRAVPGNVRPGFKEVEVSVRGGGGGGGAA